MNASLQDDIAASAARWVAEDGMEYGAAKRRAIKELGLPARTAWPSNESVEAAVREHLSIFCADTQPKELAVLRGLARTWMQRLSPFRPHLAGAVWRGTATRHNDLYLQLFCDDSKSAEIWLIDQGVRYDVTEVQGFQGEAVDALTVVLPCRELGQNVLLHLMIHDYDDLRGALKPDASGQTWRGDLQALESKITKDGES